VSAIDAEQSDGQPWAGIVRLAAAMAAREPLLRDLLRRTVLSQPGPVPIVAATLARRLAAGPVAARRLQALVVETLGADAAPLPLLEADLAAVAARDPACRSTLHALLHLKGFHALQWHRVAHSLWRRGRVDLAHWLASQCAATLGVDIHPAVTIGAGVLLDHASGIVIGETAVVEDEVVILQGVTLGATGPRRGDRHPKVRRGALLGAGALVLGPIEVGRSSRVGAGSVVLHAVPPHCTVVGVPARVVRSRRPISATGPLEAVTA